MPTPNSPEEWIEPCPLCSQPAELTEAMGEAWIRCPRCRFGIEMEDSRASAVRAWNHLVTRSTFAAAPALDDTAREE